jgi:hypothetical protein
MARLVRVRNTARREMHRRSHQVRFVGQLGGDADREQAHPPCRDALNVVKQEQSSRIGERCSPDGTSSSHARLALPLHKPRLAGELPRRVWFRWKPAPYPHARRAERDSPSFLEPFGTQSRPDRTQCREHVGEIWVVVVD